MRVTRSSDRIMAISMVIDGEIVNLISAYASQVDLNDAQMETREYMEVLVLELGIRKGARFWSLLPHTTWAFPSKACSSQHRLVILDVLFERQRHKREAIWRTRIFRKNLNGDAVETFRATVSEKLLALLKELLSCREGNQEYINMAKERYKVAKREANIVVAQAKDKAYKELYKKLDSKDGANDRYKIAKSRERRRRDLGSIRCIKDEGGRTIVMEEDIRKR
ncbi:hypothetical protein Tco_0080052 [Tanacetum coccineum]